MATRIVSRTDLDAYRKSFDVAMKVFEASKWFPKEETCSQNQMYDEALRMLVAMINDPGVWLIG